MKQSWFFLLLTFLVFCIGVISCGSNNVEEGDVDAEISNQVTKEVINPDVAAQQFCDCSLLDPIEKASCYNNWIDVYRNNPTAISQAKQMTLDMTKCNPKDALEVVEKLMSGGYYVGDTSPVILDADVLTLTDASEDFCNCISLSVVEKESCLKNWVLKYKKASGSQSEGIVLQKEMQECSAEDAKETWKNLLEK